MPSQRERKVVCENCGEHIDNEIVGGPDDPSPELGDADHLVDAESCPYCNSEDGEDDD